MNASRQSEYPLGRRNGLTRCGRHSRIPASSTRSGLLKTVKKMNQGLESTPDADADSIDSSSPRIRTLSPSSSAVAPIPHRPVIRFAQHFGRSPTLQLDFAPQHMATQSLQRDNHRAMPTCLAESTSSNSSKQRLGGGVWKTLGHWTQPLPVVVGVHSSPPIFRQHTGDSE